MIKKYIKDGEVGILYSPDFGAGWSSWCYDEEDNTREKLIFCYELVEMVLNKEPHHILEAKAKDLFPNQYLGGLNDICVQFLPVGTRFRIDEYDGSESIHIYSPDEGFVA